MMQNYSIILICIFFIFSLNDTGKTQPSTKGSGGLSLVGQVIDNNTQKPIEYAYIILYNNSDSTQVSGTVTNSEGFFRLEKYRPRSQYLEINFMGYEIFRMNDFKFKRENPVIDIGLVKLTPTIFSTEDISVEAEKAPITYKIDKKIINVSENISSSSETAVEVLENVPSVTVDIEGNVNLRGSSSFVVMIDNMPSILEPNEILQQIPASTIENIEIITNPSAKFDPDGTSGIINILTKKSDFAGISGILSLDGGLDEKYGSNILVNYRTNGLNWYFGANYRNHLYPGTSETEHKTFFNDTTNYINSNGSTARLRSGYGLRGGFEYYFNEKNYLNFGLRYGYRQGQRDSRLDYSQWSDPGSSQLTYFSIEDRERGGNYYSANLDYKREFSSKQHYLYTQLQVSQRQGDEETIDELLDANNNITDGQKSTEKGPAFRIRTKIDYKLPINENYTFESGYQSRIGSSEDNTEYYLQNLITNIYELQPGFSHHVEYDRNIHSVYSMLANLSDKFGYQIGLRGEYTYRMVKTVDLNQSFKIDRWDYFPTAHFSYTFTKGNQAMLSYTRRIDRPRGWYLEPFQTRTDAYNIRTGNPDLKPEYIDSFEFGYQYFFGRSLFSTELYYRITNNKIERVHSAIDEQVTLHTIDNVGKDYMFGSEIMINSDVMKNWNINLMGNFYDYLIEGVLLNRSFSRNSFSWNVRFNNTISLTKDTRVQINSHYNSPIVNSQGERKGYFSANLGLRQDLLNKQLSFTLQIRDLFDSAKRDHTSEGRYFYTHRLSERNAPIVMLNVKYLINNFKETRRNNRENEMDDEEF